MVRLKRPVMAGEVECKERHQQAAHRPDSRSRLAFTANPEIVKSKPLDPEQPAAHREVIWSGNGPALTSGRAITMEEPMAIQRRMLLSGGFAASLTVLAA